MSALRDLIQGNAPAWLAAGGFLIGLVFGALVFRTNFCTMGALSDIVNLSDYRRMRSWLLAIVIAVGCAVGALLAARVAMTAMPELVAVLHSFVGLAAVLVGFANYLAPVADATGHGVHLGEIYIGVLVGAVTFTIL